MGKNSHTVKLGIGLWACLCMVWSCTKKAEFINPPTKLKIQVFKEGGIPMKNARVGIFSDSGVYNAVRLFYDIAAADFDDTTDSQGFVYFDSVSSDMRYYVLCKYDSITTNSTGTKDTIAWSNSDADFQFLNPLKANTITTAQVFLSPSSGFVNFWTTNAYASRQPIDVRISGVSVATVNKIGITNGTKVRLRAGLYRYQAKSPYGCVWIDTINVKAGQIINKELETCTMVPVTIGVTSSTARQLGYSIRVVLNGTDTLKESITQYMAANATGDICSSFNTISVVRPSGTYSYQLIGSNKTVVMGTTKFEVPGPNQNCDTLIVNYK